jgi:imidazolonepropionase-like amidohydrolase
MLLLVKDVGLTPMQAITVGASNAARAMRQDSLGTIAAAKTANFIVLNANPLDDINNTRRIAKVYLRGKEVNRAALKAGWSAKATQAP